MEIAALLVLRRTVPRRAESAAAQRSAAHGSPLCYRVAADRTAAAVNTRRLTYFSQILPKLGGALGVGAARCRAAKCSAQTRLMAAMCMQHPCSLRPCARYGPPRWRADGPAVCRAAGASRQSGSRTGAEWIRPLIHPRHVFALLCCDVLLTSQYLHQNGAPKRATRGLSGIRREETACIQLQPVS